MAAPLESSLWRRALAILSQRLTAAQVETWLRPLRPLALTPAVARLGCPNRFYQAWLEEHYRDLIRAALASAGLAVEELAFAVVPMRPEEQPADSAPALELDPTLTFDRFVVGAGNQLAYEAARTVAQEPGRRYNPLVFCGEVGEGKTHLLHATGHELLRLHPELRHLQLSASALFEGLVGAVEEGQAPEFRKGLRETDVLLMDYIHSLIGREGTQEEFFHFFNALHTAGKQLVFTSRALPAALEGIAERLRSRLSWGLVVQLEPGDASFRLALAEAVRERLLWSVPSPLLRDFVEPLEVSNRELVGLLIRAASICKLSGDDPALVLQTLTAERRTAHRSLTVAEIVESVSRRLGLSARDVRSPRRAQPLARARHLIAYLAHDYAGFSLPALGQALGNRDHTTMLHSVRKARELVSKDHAFAQLARSVRRELNL
jgi:chromosomal replication initiator protein